MTFVLCRKLTADYVLKMEFFYCCVFATPEIHSVMLIQRCFARPLQTQTTEGPYIFRIAALAFGLFERTVFLSPFVLSLGSFKFYLFQMC